MICPRCGEKFSLRYTKDGKHHCMECGNNW